MRIFYRAVVQNEKFDNWFPTLMLLRQTFTDYAKLVVNYHNRPGIRIPTATNSTAAQGNFLEVLNISLNTFEKHFINRNLDRTGQQAIVITPGVGIFEVDRDLSMITKQRIIDSGVGSDLICVENSHCMLSHCSKLKIITFTFTFTFLTEC